MDKVEAGQVVESYRTHRKRSRARRTTFNLSARPETKLELRKWANEMFLDSPSDLIEYLAEKHREGLIFITGRQDFFAGMARELERQSEAAAKRVAEATTLRVLSDHGLVDSPYRK